MLNSGDGSSSFLNKNSTSNLYFNNDSFNEGVVEMDSKLKTQTFYFDGYNKYRYFGEQ